MGGFSKPLSTFADLGYSYSEDGFSQPLLGAPLGTMEFMEEALVKRVKELMATISHLHRI